MIPKTPSTNRRYVEWFRDKENHIRNNPNKHMHLNPVETIACCTADDGSVDVALLDMHDQIVRGTLNR